MPPPPQRSPAPVRARRAGGSWLHWCALGIPVALVLVTAGLFLLRLALNSFLASPDFRHFLDRKISVQLRAPSRLDPLHWQGSEIYSDALTAEGEAGGALKHLDADQLRAELNLSALWHRTWQIDSIELGQVRVGLRNAESPGETRELAPSSASSAVGASQPAGSSFLAGWLPTRMEVEKIHASDLSVAWGEGQPGSLESTELTAQRQSSDQSWEIAGRGGRLVQGALPALRLEEFALKATTHQIFITSGQAQAEGGGQVDFTGSQQLDGDRLLDADVNFDRLPSGSFLPPDWRARLQGLASGHVRISGSPSPEAGGWHATGHVELHEGRIEALPVLDDLAVFTLTARFRQATLQKGAADFDWQADRLIVDHLVLESEGLIRLEGGFTVRDGQVDGRLRVGVASAACRAVPGVGTRVFNEPEQDGYLWTTVQLSGPARSPHEDLSARLVEATQDEVTQKAQQGAASLLNSATGLLNSLGGL